LASGSVGSGTTVYTIGAAGDLAGELVCEGAGRRKWAAQKKGKKEKGHGSVAMGRLRKKMGKRRKGAGLVLRIQPKRLLRIEIPFYFISLFQNQIEFEFEWFLNEFRT
jgi:hypothetical protein